MGCYSPLAWTLAGDLKPPTTPLRLQLGGGYGHTGSWAQGGGPGAIRGGHWPPIAAPDPAGWRGESPPIPAPPAAEVEGALPPAAAGLLLPSTNEMTLCCAGRTPSEWVNTHVRQIMLRSRCRELMLPGQRLLAAAQFVDCGDLLRLACPISNVALFPLYYSIA